MKNSKKLMLIVLCITTPLTTKTIDFKTIFNSGSHFVARSWTSLVSIAKEHPITTTAAVCSLVVATAIINHKRTFGAMKYVRESAQGLHAWMKSKSSFYNSCFFKKTTEPTQEERERERFEQFKKDRALKSLTLKDKTKKENSLWLSNKISNNATSGKSALTHEAQQASIELTEKEMKEIDKDASILLDLINEHEKNDATCREFDYEMKDIAIKHASHKAENMFEFLADMHRCFNRYAHLIINPKNKDEQIDGMLHIINEFKNDSNHLKNTIIFHRILKEYFATTNTLTKTEFIESKKNKAVEDCKKRRIQADLKKESHKRNAAQSNKNDEEIDEEIESLVKIKAKKIEVLIKRLNCSCKKVEPVINDFENIASNFSSFSEMITFQTTLKENMMALAKDRNDIVQIYQKLINELSKKKYKIESEYTIEILDQMIPAMKKADTLIDKLTNKTSEMSGFDIKDMAQSCASMQDCASKIMSSIPTGVQSMMISMMPEMFN